MHEKTHALPSCGSAIISFHHSDIERYICKLLPVSIVFVLLLHDEFVQLISSRHINSVHRKAESPEITDAIGVHLVFS